MSKHEKSSRREYRDSDRGDRYDRHFDRESRKDRGGDKGRSDTRRRRQRSPSYDSYSSSDSDYDSDSSRDPSPRRPTRRRTTAYSDSEDRGGARGTRGRDRGRDRRRNDRYDSPSPSPERRGIVDDLMAAIGLVRSKNDRSGGQRSDRDAERSKDTKKALQAALTAAAMEAFRTRKEGKLTPQRLIQIAGAAVAAGGLDALVERLGGDGGSLRHIIESVVGGLATGETMGKKLKHKRDESVGDKTKAGMVGMAAKQILARSLSQGPSRRRTNKW